MRSVGAATAYVISGGGDFEREAAGRREASLEAMGEAGGPIADSSGAGTDGRDLRRSYRSCCAFRCPFTSPAIRHRLRRRDDRHARRAPPFRQRGLWRLRFHAGTWGSVQKPTFLVVGEQDRATTTRSARVLQEGIGGSELAVIRGVGHMSLVEAPDEYLEAVRGFLGRFKPAR